jgi:polysaccharide biosynthesis/export protein
MLHRSAYVLTLLAALITPLVVCGQSNGLLIGPGDLIQIDVLDTPEMEQQARVTDEGMVPLAYIGEVHVAGDTPAQAATAIQSALTAKKIMLHPQVTVRVQEYATQDVSVLGQVRNPGAYPITTSQTILRVLSLAGGLTDVADRHVTIKRHGSEDAINYYVANDSKEALSNIPEVNPGDTVLVPRAPMIYIMGDVNRPGGYTIATNDAHLSVLQAISMAGSANKTSVKSHVRLIRTTSTGTVELPVHLDAIEKGKQPDITLQANDVLYVPFSWLKNTAMNASSIAASTAGAAVYVVH